MLLLDRGTLDRNPFIPVFGSFQRVTNFTQLNGLERNQDLECHTKFPFKL